MITRVRPQLAGQPGGILFLGDFPADEELVKGFSFVGASGFLLHHGLRAARLTQSDDPPQGYLPHQRPETRRLLWERRAHSFTNVCDWQLPKSQTPWKLVREEDLARLKEEIDQCQPTLIVPLGGTALWALTGSAAIDTYRGAVGVATTPVAPGRKLLPTYHPGHILQTYKLFDPFVSDLAKAKREAGFPEVRLEPVEIWLDPTLDDLAEFRARYIGRWSGPLSVDIETGGGQISCISFSPTAWQAIIVPFVDYRSPDRSYWATEGGEVKAWEFVAAVLGDPEVEKLFQNGGAFDVFWFLDRMGIEVRNYRHDLRLVHKALWPELPASLKFMAASHANIHAWKANISHHKEDEKRDS